MIEFNQTLYAFDFFVKLNFIRLLDFRNVEFAEVRLDAPSVWIHGANAQGKTNLLEAVGMLNAARSFRSASPEALVRMGAKTARILAEAALDGGRTSQIEIAVGEEKYVVVDGEKTAKLADFIGKFPVLTITNEDIRLLRSSPEVRRRDMDMFASSVDSEYLYELRKYHRALAQRNALLRAESADGHLYDAFETAMAQSAETIIKKRKALFAELGTAATQKYAILAGESPDRAEINLKTNFDAETVGDFLEMFSRQRQSDMLRRTTQKGIHRDDFKIFVDSADAKTYASEGQQKSAVIALRLAQFELAKKYLGEEPVMLFDDVLGELDANRRRRFWSCASPTAQILATSTEEPPTDGARQWSPVRVECGKFEQ